MPERQTKPSRRGFMLGAAAAGAAATAVATLPQVQTAPELPVTETVKPPERGGGYRASEHVEQYYRTTRV